MLGTSFQKRLRIETLEEKVPLAGDVTVAVVDGDLVITGDAADNSFQFEQAPLTDGHQLRIKGTELTNINGVTNEWVFFDGVTRDVIINLGDGADGVWAYGFPTGDTSLAFAVPRDLVINLGAGDDHLALGVTASEELGAPLNIQSPVHVGRDITINLGDGNDSVLMSATEVGDDLSISDSGGNTEIFVWPSFVWQFPIVAMNVGDDLSVNLSSGDDIVDFSEITIGGDATFGLGGGNDYSSLLGFETAGSVLVNAGAGTNEVHVGSGTVGGGVLMTGSGANFFQIDLLNVTSSIVVLTNNNDDQLYINSSNAGSAIISSRGGSDYVQLVDSTFDLLAVNLGGGSDTLNLDGVSADLALLMGGGGSDTLQESANNNFLLAIDLSFEVFETV